MGRKATPTTERRNAKSGQTELNDDEPTCKLFACESRPLANGYCGDHQTRGAPLSEETADRLAEEIGRRPSYLRGGR